MLCEQCLQKSADMLLTRRSTGTVTRSQLCRTCAEPLVNGIGPDDVTGVTYLAPDIAGELQKLPEQIEVSDASTVQELATALHLKPCQVIGTLMRQEIFAAARDPIDSAAVSLVCSLYGVKMRGAKE